MNDIATLITSLGLPTALLLYYLWRNDKDKAEFSEKLDAKDKLNREDTEKRIAELKEYNDERMAESEKRLEENRQVMLQVVETNNQLSITNAKLYNSIDTKIDSLDKKVGKIEIILEQK